ncbi:MAG TPA: hypothetical protein PK329_03430, partial [Myxococcota bacterium]|nr:hypothetical protein [Myxococcota bacterium]HPL24425.1 hypothetical protein [Myxococcota bacterium]HQE72700.1 hypothetical protein [Myxococcota bacterium]HQI60749.1 hypothetical protein [Myxococcota bacterium]
MFRTPPYCLRGKEHSQAQPTKRYGRKPDESDNSSQGLDADILNADELLAGSGRVFYAPAPKVRLDP